MTLGPATTQTIRAGAGGAHTCALSEDGRLRCWGLGTYGQLGYGDRDSVGDDELVSVMGDVDLGGSAAHIAVGWEHTCALLSSGDVRCWGRNSMGQLGHGTGPQLDLVTSPTLGPEVDIGGTVTELALGGEHSCALLDTGAVRCWGDGFYGQHGHETAQKIGHKESPASAGDVDVGGAVKQLSLGHQHTCALLTTGAVRCWGRGTAGRLGYGDTKNIGVSEAPASAGDVDLGGTALQISAGAEHTCALLDTGSVRCWGDGRTGALGYADSAHIGDNESPASAGDVEVGGEVQQISAGGNHTCALLTTGAVRCWGRAKDGRLGYGDTENVGDDETPASAGDVPLGGEVQHIAASAASTCVLLVEGEVRCWGLGGWGQLGSGDTESVGDDELPESAGDVSIW